MDPSRMAEALAYLTLEEVPEFLRAVALFERCGILSPGVAAVWREAVAERALRLLPFHEGAH